MLLLGAWGLGRNSLFGSEADTYWAARLPLPDLARLLSHLDAVHGTYYLFMKVWMSPGAGFVWLRLPSVLGMAAAATLLSVLTARLTGRAGPGLVAGMLFVLTPSIATWAQNGRSYALVVAAVAASTVAFVRAVNGDVMRLERSRRRWMIFGALTVLAGYLHEFTLLLIAAFGLSLLWAGVPKSVVKRWLITSAVAGVIVLPLVVFSARQRAAVAHLRPARPADLTRLFEQLFGANLFVAGALCVLAVVGALPALRSRATGRLTVASLGVPMLLAPPVILLAESRLAHPLYDPRYVLYSTLAAAMLTACGVEQVGRVLAAAIRGRSLRARTRVAVSCSVLVCVATAAVSWPTQQYLRTPASRGEDYGAAARYVARHRESGEALVFMSAGARNAQLGFPNDFTGLHDVASAISPERSGTFRGVNKSAAAAVAALVAYDQVLVLGQFPFRQDPKGLTGMASVLTREFTVEHVQRFAGVSVIVFDKRSRYEPNEKA